MAGSRVLRKSGRVSRSAVAAALARNRREVSLATAGPLRPGVSASYVVKIHAFPAKKGR